MLRNILFIVVIIAFSVVTANSFDRNSIHQDRLNGVATENRPVENPKVDFVSFSAALTDYQISESVIPATFDQDHLCLLALNDGSWLAVFADNRLGSNKIFYQKYDASGNPVGDNTVLATSSLGQNLVDPKLVQNSEGKIYLLYRNQSSGLIIATRLNADLTTDKPPLLVNDTTSAYAGPFDFALYPSGKMVVVWENYSGVGSNINFRIFDSSMTALTSPALVNSDGGSVSHWEPSVAVDNSGNFVVTWEDYRNSNADVYLRLFNGSGVALGSEQALVPPPSNTAAQYAPEVIYTPATGFVVGWIDLRTNQDVYLQRYEVLSGFVGGNFVINEINPQYINWNLDLALNENDELVTCWAAFGPLNNILRLPFDGSLNAVGSPEAINQATTGRRWEPTIKFATDGKSLAGWTEFHPENDNADMLVSFFDGTGSATGSELMVNDDTEGAISDNPVIAPLTTWYNLVAYSDQQNDAGDVFCRTISNNGIPLNNPIRVNQDNGNNLQSEISVASSVANGKGLILWVDSRDVNAVPGQRIYGRFTNQFGSFISDEFMISDSASVAVKLAPKAIFDATGNGLVVWSDSRSGSYQIYGRKININGTLTSDEFIISNSLNDLSNIKPFLGVDSFNRMYVTWLDNGGAEAVIKTVWYNSSGVEAARFNWSPTVEDVTIDDFAGAVSSDGKIYLLWSGTDQLLYLTVLNNSGVVTTAPFVITDDAGAIASKPSIAVDNNNYVSAVWVDRRNGKKEVYYLVLDNGNNPLDFDNPVIASTPELMDNPQTSALNGRAWYVWTDSKSEGLNIYGGNFVYQPTDITEPGEIIPNRFELRQNYPNPFNPSTTIAFSLNSANKVNLTVYNIVGQKIITLVDGTLEAGEHKVDWDGKNEFDQPVASGIYLYRLETSHNSSTKKMMLLK